MGHHHHRRVAALVVAATMLVMLAITGAGTHDRGISERTGIPFGACANATSEGTRAGGVTIELDADEWTGDPDPAGDRTVNITGTLYYESSGPSNVEVELEDVASAILMLCRNDSMTGQVVTVDAGLTLVR